MNNKRTKFSLFYLLGKSLVKITAVLLIIAFNWSGLSAVIETIASFNDAEDLPQNIFVASTLDFSLDLPPDFSPVIMPNATSSRDISLTNEGILGFEYTVTTANATATLCNFLNLEAKLDGTTTYTGPLTSFNFNAGEFSTSTDDWQFTATLTDDDPALQNKTCKFDFVFDGEQIGGAGFYDQEIISNTITSGIWLKVVINKVYYDVDDNHGGDTNEWKHEWVELYNPLNQDINIKDWVICDNNDCKTINPNVSIQALGFALLSHDASTWQYWEVPTGVEKINLGGAPSHLALNNDADMLILKNKDGVIIDQMNWGTPTSTWPNYNEYVWDPGVPDAPQGHILARVPTGVDTDTISDWKNLGLPQVTVTYPTGGTWYCNATYNLKWTAINPNGDNNELTIDIIYITDNDKNGIISPGDHTYLIADNIQNTGSYPFKIDFFKGYCFYGYVWIKVIATGPENFMVNNFGISGRVFEPPDPDLLNLQESCFSIDEYCGESEEICLAMKEFCAAAQIYFPEVFSSNEESITTVDGNTQEETTPQDGEIITEENQTEEGIIDEINEIIDEVIDKIVDEIMPDEETGDEVVDTSTIEEAPADETPAVEEQPAILPDDGFNQEGENDVVGDGGISSGGDSGATETGGESTSSE